MALSAGTRIGPYEIVGVLGAGGMGEVYRARDRKLNRDVAIKVLPEGFTLDEDRLARFTREAQVLASLNHPNIASIYGFEESGGIQALVLELVDGATLAERIAQGPVTLDDVLLIARQVADALEAAHELGIIHRDLKPSNIKLRSDGAVKLLDFGLAKMLDPVGMGAPHADSPTITTPAMTGIGVILGTAAYMSPEQAKGRAADKRSDVWAFGCVVFEMLSGTRAFEGEDVSDTLAAVLKDEPPWQRLPPGTPESIRRLLRRCLQKDRKDRLRDIGDARLEIDAAKSAPDPGRVVVARRHPMERIVLIGAVAIATIVAAVSLLRPARPVSREREMRVDISTPPTRDPMSLAISPDGRSVVFAATSRGRPMLWLRSFDAGVARPLAGTEDSRYPFWSPDSRSVAFFSAIDDKLKRIDVDSGTLQALTTAAVGRGGAWNRDGVILFAPIPDVGLLRISANGGAPQPATRVERPQQTGHRFPRFLPDGRHFLYYVAGTADARGVYVGELDGSLARRLLDADAPAVYAAGHLLFVRQRTLWAQDFDPIRLESTGNPLRVAEGIELDAFTGLAALSASAAGPVVYRTGTSTGEAQFTWFDRSGKKVGNVGGPDVGRVNPTLSPDGRFVALSQSVNGNTDIWLLDVGRGVFTRFTSDPVPDIYPVWSPDGQRIVYSSTTPGKAGFDLYEKPVSGAAGRLLTNAAQVGIAMDWSSDGRFVLYRNSDPKTGWDIWAKPLDGAGNVFPVMQTPFDDRDGQFSPDGKWLAYQSNESGRFEIYVQLFPGPGGKQQISTGGGSQVRWGRGAKEIFYIAPDGRLMAVAIRFSSHGQVVDADAPVALFQTDMGTVAGGSSHLYDVAPDGQRFLINTLTEGPSSSPITMILNWSAK